MMDPATDFLRAYARTIRKPEETVEEARARARAELPTIAGLAGPETERETLRLARAH